MKCDKARDTQLDLLAAEQTWQT